MRNHTKYLVTLTAALGALLITPLAPAQSQSVTRIRAIGGNGAAPSFSVDGFNYTQSAAFLWPTGSKHTLTVDPLVQADVSTLTQYAFQSWSFTGTDSQGGAASGSFSSASTVTITADPAITEYDATFLIAYQLQVLFYPCNGTNAPGPGIVTVNGVPYTCDLTGYYGGPVTIQATPSPGYVFTGYSNPGGQAIAGFQSTVNMTGPQIVFPGFAPTRTVNFATSPTGLGIYADHSPVYAPASLEWGMGTTHTVSPMSPQMDKTGHSWVFASWSDGGAAQHAYTVASNVTADTLTATFNPALGAIVNTSPAGLSLSVDGKSGTGGTFTWGLGETHTLAAPAQQTDATGHVWQFSAWSNGGAQSQSVTVTADEIAAGLRFVATFTPVGHLTVSSSLAGVSFSVNGSSCAAPCDLKQPVGTQVTVSAPASFPAGAGSRQDLAGWTGASSAGPGPVTVRLGPDPMNLTAAYQLMNQLSLGGSPANSVSFSLQPASGDGYYPAGATVAVAAATNPGFHFRNWSGDLSGTTPSASVTMNSPHAAMAITTPVPYVPPAGVANAAGSTPQAGVAPGSIVSIFGVNLAGATVVGPSSPLTQSLAGLTVTMAGRFLPLIFVSPSQINLQLPADAPAGAGSFVVSSAGQPDVQAPFTVAPDAPGLFQQVVNGQSFAVAVHGDGSAITAASPAVLGEQITLYGTGFGPTNPARPFGFPVPAAPVYATTDSMTVSTGSGAPLAGNGFASPGAVGIDAVQFTLSDPTLSGTNAAITVTVNGQASNIVLLPVQ